MPVSAEVLAALKQSGLPVEASSCLGALATGEGGRSFLSLYGDSASHPNLWSGPLDHFPTSTEWPGGTGPDGRPTSALGFLQFLRGTYADCAAATGLAGIDPQSQIANGWWLAQRDYAKHTGGGDLLAALQDGRTNEVASALVSTWPGGANPQPNPRTGFLGFPAAYTTVLALLSTSDPIPHPPPPVIDPIADSLASLATQFERISRGVGLAVAKIRAPTTDPQTIAAQIDDISARMASLSDSIDDALALGVPPSFRSWPS